MANTLNKLIPFLIAAVQQIGRELVGIIPAVTMDMTADSAAKNQVIRVPVTPMATAEDITIGTPPDVSGDEFIPIEMRIDNFRRTSFIWNGEEEAALGSTVNGLKENQILQRMRTLVNEIEASVFAEAINGAEGGSYGVPGTTPFGNDDMREFAQLVKIMNDAASPQTGRQMVLNTTHAAALRNKPNLFKVGDAGESGLLRQGVLANLYGFDIRETGGATTMTVGGSQTLPSAVFTRDAILLATRAPFLPEGGDTATDVFPVSDPLSGLTFQVASYPGYLNRRVEIRVAWGVKTVNPQNSFILHG